MRGRRLFLLAVLSMPLFTSPLASLPETAGSTIVAIENVTIIDTTATDNGTAQLPGRTVLITGDRITQIGPAFDTAIPEKATRIDGSGKFLIPGLWDMHVHLNRDRPTAVDVMLPLMVANGVTGVRDLLSDCWEPCPAGRLTINGMRELQQEIEDGEVLGPHIATLSSPLVSGHHQNPSQGDPDTWKDFYRPNTADEAREVVRYLKERDVDVIKIYAGLPRPAFFALMKEARKLDLDVAGHLPWSVTPVEAAEAGMHSIEHARFPAFACGPDYEAWRAAYAPYAALEVDEFPEEEFQQMRKSAVAKFDEAACVKILKTLARNDTYLVPTHTTRKMDAMAGDPEYRADPRRKYIPPWRIRSWDRDLDNTSDGPPELLQFYKEFFDLGLRVTGLAHRNGVKILTATDTIDTQCFPGFSLHDELENLVMAGLSPLEAVKAATLLPAEFSRLGDRFGSVAVGKHADLVLLNADPLQDIAATRAIHAVILHGEVHDRDALDAMLQGVEDFVASVTPPERQVVELDPALYNTYAGEYQFEGFVLTLFRDGDKLMVQVGENKIEILPTSETEFFSEAAMAEITFMIGDDGQVKEILLRQRGQETKGKRKVEDGP